MTLNMSQKQAIVSELGALAKDSISAVAADYRGLTVSDMTQLRKTARESGVNMRVYRNTLARLALKDTDFACLEDTLVGPIVLFFTQEEPGAPARLLRDFMKSNDSIEVKALAMDGALISPDQLAAVASLPSKDEAIAKLMSMMMAPITQFVRTVNEPVAQVARAVAAVRDKKQES